MLAAAPVLGLAVNAIVQIACAHATHRIGLAIAAGALGGLVATALIAAGSASSDPGLIAKLGDWTLAVLTYAALAFGYWAFLNLNRTSLRIRILRELLGHPAGISPAEFAQEYSADELLQRRLQRLEGGGHLSCRDGRWRLQSNKLLATARVIDAVRALILPAWVRQRREG